MRWRDNPKRDEINKKYKQNSKYAQQEARHLAKLYKQIRKSDWWYEQSKKGCNNCGSFDKLGVDHIIARINGGTDDYENLQVLCSKHNGEKWVK